MSFISKIKSPLMKRHFTLFQKDIFDSQHQIDSDQPIRSLIIYHIDAADNEGTLSLTVNNSDYGDVLINKVCENYNLNEYKEYFGLKYTVTDEKGNYEILWLDPLKTIGKQLKYSNNTLTFRVKHFPAYPHRIESADVRYLIFLQLKAYLQKGELQLSLNDEILLASFVLQSEYGDFDENIFNQQKNYLKDKKLMSKKSDKIDEAIIELHKKLVGYKPEDAEFKFLEHISLFNTYGAEILTVKNKQGVPVNFGVSHRGIITYLHGTPANIARIELYPWSQIGKISFENRSLHIHAHTPDPSNSEIIKKHSMVFKCNSERLCKHLWKFILDQKAFFTFNRGIDVPKIRSSKRIFGRTSKFRYSGRCEHEILASQQDISQNTSINTSAYNSLHRRPMKYFKALISNNDNNNIDKSFTDSGLSENYAETLPKCDETESNNTNSILTTTPIKKIDNENKLNELNSNLIINDNDNNNNIIINNNKQLTPTINNNNNNNKLDQPAATSTPQLKKLNGDINNLLNIQTNTTNTNNTSPIRPNSTQPQQIIPKITITESTSTTSLLTTAKESELNNDNNTFNNNNNIIQITKYKSSNIKKYIHPKFIIISFIIIAILFIIFYILPSNSSYFNNTTGNCIYSTVNNFLKSSANSVSLSVKENLHNSQLLFDPIFSFFLRNYQN